VTTFCNQQEGLRKRGCLETRGFAPARWLPWMGELRARATPSKEPRVPTAIDPTPEAVAESPIATAPFGPVAVPPSTEPAKAHCAVTANTAPAIVVHTVDVPLPGAFTFSAAATQVCFASCHTVRCILFIFTPLRREKPIRLADAWDSPTCRCVTRTSCRQRDRDERGPNVARFQVISDPNCHARDEVRKMSNPAEIGLVLKALHSQEIVYFVRLISSNR
jgi:hypothetical protein